MIVAHVGAVGGGAGTAALKVYHGTRRAGVEAVYFTLGAHDTSTNSELRPLPRYRVASPSSARGLLFRAAIKAYHTGRPSGAGLFSYTSLPFRSPSPFDVVRPDSLTVVAVSRAHRDEARRSPLFAEVPEISVIPVGIDTTVFAPLPRKAARAQLGQVGLEAMACGTPVVGSRTGGIPDYVIDGVTGRLFDVSDAAGLAGSLDALRQADETRHRMGEAARALVERQFSVDGVTRAYLDLYERVLSARTRVGVRDD